MGGNDDIKSIKFSDFLNGAILRHPKLQGQINYLLFIALLVFVHITYHYNMEKKQEYASILIRDNQELRYEETTTSSQLMLLSKQSEVVRRLEDEGIDLKQMTTPPRKLKVR